MQKTANLLNVLVLLFITFSYSQNKQIRAYDLDDGLPQSQVYDIIQDTKGYLWLGTQGGGIARFDGTNFKTWNERKGLISNYIHAL
ncbi:MAG: two-component regulator propeller domain-containing protein, partial [Flavobacteriaceae bacterium]